MKRIKLEDSRNAMTGDDVEVWLRDGDHFEQQEQLDSAPGSVTAEISSLDLFTVEHTNLAADATVDPAFRGFGLASYQSDLEASDDGRMRAVVRTILDTSTTPARCSP